MQSSIANDMVGVGLRSTHYPHLETRPRIHSQWFEAISENYMSTEGRPRQILLKVREDYPVGLHGVGMSIGAHDGVNEDYLQKLKNLVEVVQPGIVSDHLCWTSMHGHYSHDLLPLPLTFATAQRIVTNIDRVQNFLDRQLLLENISFYVSSRDDEMSEAAFLNFLCERSGCGVLFDFNNLYVNSVNHGFDALAYLRDLRLANVGQIHIGGPEQDDGFLFDTHSTPAPSPVWELYSQALRVGLRAPTLIEWDDKIPPFDVLELEVLKAREILLEVGVGAQVLGASPVAGAYA